MGQGGGRGHIYDTLGPDAAKTVEIVETRLDQTEGPRLTGAAYHQACIQTMDGLRQAGELLMGQRTIDTVRNHYRAKIEALRVQLLERPR